MLHDAFRITAMPEHPSSIQCHCAGNQCYANAYPSKSLPLLSHSIPKRIVSMPDHSYLCHSDTWLNGTIPLRLNSLLCRSYTRPCQCSATPLVCYSMPKPSAPLLCPNIATLRLAFAPRFFSLPAQLFSMPRLCPSMPGPFIAIQCLCFAMPVLTSRYSASAIRFLSLPLRDASSPCLYSAYLRSALTPQIPASPFLITTFHCRNVALLNRNCSLQCLCSTLYYLYPSNQLRFVALPCFAFSRRFTTLAFPVDSMPLHFTAIASIKHFPLKSTFAGIAPLAQTVIASEVEPIHNTANQLATCHDIEFDI